MDKIIILNGPNLNLLGEREKVQYGSFTLEDIEKRCKDYSNKNNITLTLFQSNLEGALVEKISGLQLGEYMEANIFKPLGMNDTAFEVPEDKLHRVAALFTPNKFTVQIPGQTKNFVPFEEQNYCRKKPAAHTGGAGLCSTVDDFSKFMSAIMNDGKAIGGQILEPTTLKLLLENQLPAELGDDPLTQSFGPAGKDLYFSLGLGISTDSSRNPRYYWWAGAANTFFWFDF